jgi:hypothetical protein
LGKATVVSGGWVWPAAAMSSMPTTERSPGTARHREIPRHRTASPQAAQQAGRDPGRVSCIRILRVVRRHVAAVRGGPAPPPKKLKRA